MKNTIKAAVKFTLLLLPFAAIGGFFTGRYSIATLDAATEKLLVAQLGSTGVLTIMTTLQSIMYTFFCAMSGYILAEKVGLLKRFSMEKDKIVKALSAGVVCGVLFSMDYWVFGKCIPQVAASYESEITIKSVDNWIASILYGGIVEEIMLRFFMMSLVALILWKLFFRSKKQEELPVSVYVIANVICAVLFAAGHLPATIASFGGLSLLIVIRCFLLNGLFGFVFGELYRRYGIGYAILGHMGTHIVSKMIWLYMI